MKKQRLDAAAIASAAAVSARPMIDERNHRLTLSTSAGPLDVDADPADLEQLLAGLLGQVAGSLAPGGRIRLSVGRERDEIVFRVGDQGGGPSAAGLDGEEERDDAPAPLRALAERSGGSASVRGERPGQGGEFVVRMPAAADPRGPAAAQTPGARPAPAGERILVVDDNVDAARGVARLLQIAGHDVRVAHDGEQALEAAHAHRPRFILLDIALPGMDGYEVARRLRADPQYGDTTIIALSGFSEDDYQQAEETVFDHHLVKPVDYASLKAILGGPAGREG